MNLIKTNLYFIIIINFLVTPLLVVSQIDATNDLTKAIKLFDKGNFAEAEPLVKKVLNEKPDDFMVNYFYGACRTENNHFTNSDLECLILANEEVSPIDINYYFGVQYHARSNWDRALKFYSKYKSTASLAESEERKISEKIQQCYNKINPFEEFMVDENIEVILPDTILDGQIPKNDSTKAEVENQHSVIANETLEAETTILDLKNKSINFIVNSEITYLYTSHFKTEEGKQFFMKSDSLQKILDLSLLNVKKLRGKYASAKTRAEKNSIGEKIMSYENEIYQLKNNATKFLLQAKKVESEYWENASSEEIEEFIKNLGSISKKNKTNTSLSEKDSFDTKAFIDPNILLVGAENISQAVEQNDTDLIYKIQIGAHTKLPRYKKKLFDKLSLIRKIENYTDENGVVVYTTGNLTNYEDAEKMKNQVRQEGIKDAQIVPYLKGKRITLKQAKKL